MKKLFVLFLYVSAVFMLFIGVLDLIFLFYCLVTDQWEIYRSSHGLLVSAVFFFLALELDGK